MSEDLTAELEVARIAVDVVEHSRARGNLRYARRHQRYAWERLEELRRRGAPAMDVDRIEATMRAIDAVLAVDLERHHEGVTAKLARMTWPEDVDGQVRRLRALRVPTAYLEVDPAAPYPLQVASTDDRVIGLCRGSGFAWWERSKRWALGARRMGVLREWVRRLEQIVLDDSMDPYPEWVDTRGAVAGDPLLAPSERSADAP